MFTKEALKEDRYFKRPHREDLKVHPRDWFQAWGPAHPAEWKQYDRVRGVQTKSRLYPFYSVERGWEWVLEGSLKHTCRP